MIELEIWWISVQYNIPYDTYLDAYFYIYTCPLEFDPTERKRNKN